MKHAKGNWKEVKLTGNLITDDSTGTLEGLIGLEVLEEYDKGMVTKSRGPKRRIQPRREDEDDPSPITPKKLHTRPAPGPLSNSGQFVMAPTQMGMSSDGDAGAEDDTIGKFVKAPIDELDTDYSEALPEWQCYNLQNDLLKALYENGFTRPTEIQRLTLFPAILGRRDILGAAETGSGKTLAFGLPILNGILHLKEQWLTNPKCSIRKAVYTEHSGYRSSLEGHVQNEEETNETRPLFAVILTPTRELAVQIQSHIKAIAKYTGIGVACIFGGMAAVKQKRILRGCPEIVVATPGRLWELLREGDEHLSKINDIHFLVIDETDRMVEKGHFEEVKLLMERLNRDESKKSKRQNFIFSATLTLVHDIPNHLRMKNVSRRKKFESVSANDKLKQFIYGLGISQPKIVDITKKEGTAEKLTECRIVCELTEKDYYLYYFLQQHPGRTIVFCNSIDCVRRLGNLFDLLQCKTLPLHANMIQKQRLKNLERFRDSKDALLIATDVAARGLDIPNVDHVIHYQVPRTSENYIHRSGRTARANTEGITVLLMEPGEMRYYKMLCKTLNRSEDIPLFPISFRHLNAVKDRVNLARQVDVLELRARKESSEIGWFEKAAEEMDILLDDDLGNSLDDNDEDNSRNSRKKEIAKSIKMIKVNKDELNKLLQSPIFPKGGFSYKYPTATGKLEIPLLGLSTSNNAVTVMKNSLKANSSAKKGSLLKDYESKPLMRRMSKKKPTKM